MSLNLASEPGAYPDVLLSIKGVKEGLVALRCQKVENRKKTHDEIGLHGLVSLLARLARKINAL
jgi:hypothetical protein